MATGQVRAGLDRRFFGALMWTALLSVGSNAVHAQSASFVPNCGGLQMKYAFGPFDYRTEHGEPKRLVEGAHFKPQIEALISGKTADSPPGGDIAYTLRAFPNHHRALVAVMRLGEKTKTDTPKGVEYPVECWFKRAVTFRHDDTVARLLYVTFLNRAGRTDDARAQLDQAASMAGDQPFTHYNVGLMYLELKAYDKAAEHARQARKLGFERAELRERLEALGKWPEESPPPELPASSAPVTPAKSQP